MAWWKGKVRLFVFERFADSAEVAKMVSLLSFCEGLKWCFRVESADGSLDGEEVKTIDSPNQRWII